MGLGRVGLRIGLELLELNDPLGLIGQLFLDLAGHLLHEVALFFRGEPTLAFFFELQRSAPRCSSMSGRTSDHANPPAPQPNGGTATKDASKSGLRAANLRDRADRSNTKADAADEIRR